MFYSLSGKLIVKSGSTAVVECGGVGFTCGVTLQTLQRLPQIGEPVTLYTHLSVREDALDLFGFADPAELDFFRLLIGVSGIGPKVALAVLSQLPPDRLALCIATGDAKSITRAQGVGPKVAQRIVMELKDKVGKLCRRRRFPGGSHRRGGGIGVQQCFGRGGSAGGARLSSIGGVACGRPAGQRPAGGAARARRAQRACQKSLIEEGKAWPKRILKTGL